MEIQNKRLDARRIVLLLMIVLLTLLLFIFIGALFVYISNGSSPQKNVVKIPHYIILQFINKTNNQVFKSESLNEMTVEAKATATKSEFTSLATTTTMLGTKRTITELKEILKNNALSTNNHLNKTEPIKTTKTIVTSITSEKRSDDTTKSMNPLEMENLKKGTDTSVESSTHFITHSSTVHTPKSESQTTSVLNNETKLAKLINSTEENNITEGSTMPKNEVQELTTTTKENSKSELVSEKTPDSNETIEPVKTTETLVSKQNTELTTSNHETESPTESIQTSNKETSTENNYTDEAVKTTISKQTSEDNETEEVHNKTTSPVTTETMRPEANTDPENTSVSILSSTTEPLVAVVNPNDEKNYTELKLPKINEIYKDLLKDKYKILM